MRNPELVKFTNALYAQIKFRVGSIKRKRYYGLGILSRPEYDNFCLDPLLDVLFNAWVTSGRKRPLVPTIDRIDSSLGYVVGNIRWTPLGDNSARARFDLRKKPSGLLPGTRFEGGRYSARIRQNYKEIYLGAFDTEELAHQAYLAAKKAQGR